VHLIDLDHNRLSLLIRYVIHLIDKKKSIHLIKKYGWYIGYALNMHFNHEERIMEEIKYPSIEKHKRMHKEMMDIYKDFTFVINKSSCMESLKEKFLRILSWLEFHVLQEDMQLKPYIKQNKNAENISKEFYKKMYNNKQMKEINKAYSEILNLKENF